MRFNLSNIFKSKQQENLADPIIVSLDAINDAYLDFVTIPSSSDIRNTFIATVKRETDFLLNETDLYKSKQQIFTDSRVYMTLQVQTVLGLDKAQPTEELAL